MTKKWKDPQLYNKLYEHDLPWARALWIVRPLDYIMINGVLNCVRSVYLPPIDGAVPQITLEEEDGTF